MPARRKAFRTSTARATAIASVLFAAASAAAQAPAGVDQRILAEMNRERAAVGVPPLAWDPALAADAAAYVAVLAERGRLDHSPRASRPGQSENLWIGTRGAFTPEQMIGFWAAEKARFRPGVFPDVSSTGNWFEVTHYTQMIWRGTTRVGCATARDRSSDFLVCRFSPRGNVEGQRVP